MKTLTKKFVRDVAERTFWTAAEAGTAYLSTVQWDLDPVLTVPIATGLAALKGLIAKHVGTKNTAAIGS